MIVLQPGWYWWLVMPQDAKAWGDFVLANGSAAKGPLRVRKVFRGQGEKNEIPVFEVIGGGSLVWTLPTAPAKAKKGFATELGDIIAGPDASPSLVSAVEDIAGKPVEALKSATSALTLLAYGAVAIVLFNLFRRTAPEPAPVAEEA